MGLKSLSTLLLLSLASCFHDAADPFSLAPSTPFSSWTPMKGNQCISARYCQTFLPKTFGDGELNLAELIDIGLMNNPSTKQTWAEARAAAGQYGQSLSSFYPEIQLLGQYTRQKGSTGGTQSTGTALFSGTYATTAGPDFLITYTLFDFGQRTSAATAAREALYMADWTHNQEIQTVIQTVMDDYYAYLYQLKILRANETNLEMAGASLDAANQKFALGLAALGDVAQARTQYLQSKINLTTQKKNVENAFAQLAVDLGLPANIPFKVQPMPENVQPGDLLESVDQLVAMAQSERQDLLAAQANLRSKEALLLNAKRAAYPVFTTTLDGGKYWFQKGLVEDYHWTAQIALSVPLFQGFFYKNGIKIAEANYEEACAQLMQTELSVISSVTTSQMNAKTAAQNLKDTEEYLKAAELEFTIALTSYKAGTMTILDVLSAQSSVTDARSKKAGAEKDWFTSLASLSYATGSLCWPKESI